MQGIKISQVGRIFALAAPSDSRGHRNGRIKKTKEERRVMIVSFVEKYKASNEGKFPSATHTFKEVGGTYYTVREILQELKQESVSCDSLATDLEAIETKKQTRHVIEPLSLPAESAKNGAIGNHHSFEHKDANYQETLSETEEKKIVIHNDVLETHVNNKTQVNEGRKIVGISLGSNPTSLVVDSQPLQGLTKGQPISSVINGAINSDHQLELSKALSDTEEKGNIVHNDVLEIREPNDQTQAKQVINNGERPPRTSAASIARNQDVLLQGIKGDISTESIGVRDNNHGMALDKAEYLETLSDTEEQKTMIQNGIVRTFGQNDHTHKKQEIKIVERSQGPCVASVVGVQPLQEIIEGQSISSVTGGFTDKNHILEINEAKYQEALSDTQEKKNIIHNDVETHGQNDQTQVKQEITFIEESPGTSAASNPLVTLEYHEEGEEHLHLETSKSLSLSSDSHSSTCVAKHLKDLPFSDASAHYEDDNDLVLNSTKGITEEPAIPADKIISHLTNSVTAPQEATEIPDNILDSNHILEINEAKYQEALSDTEEKKNFIHNDMETCGLNDQTQVKKEITIIEESPGTSAASNPLIALEYHEEGEELLHLETSKPLSLSSDSHSTTCVTNQPKDVSVSGHHEYDNDLVLNSTKGIAEEPASPAEKLISPLTNSVTAPQEATESPDNILDCNHVLEINESKYQEAFSDTEEKKNFIHNDMETCGLNDQTQVKKEITIIEESPGTSAASNPLVALEYHEEGEEHLHLETSKPLSLSSDSHSTICVTNQPKDVSVSAHHEYDNDLVLNSTKGIAEEPAIPADKLISPLTNSVTAPQEATEIPDNISDDKKLTALNISSDQVLTGVKAFYQVLLHRLALSALVIKTLIHAGDASQKGSSEFQSENLDGYSHSKYCIDLSDKKETATVLSSSSLDQGASTQDTLQSTQKTNSDGYCASNSVKKISSYQEESTGNIMQISHDLSAGNCTPTLENNERTYKNTNSSKDREKLETNMVSDFVNNILKGILYLLKK